MSVFEKYRAAAFPFKFSGQLHIGIIAGGTPTDPNVAEGWLKAKLVDKDDLIREMVAETMVERGVTAEEATIVVNANKHLNGFKRDPERGLYVEGRQLKAAIKEATSVAYSTGKLLNDGKNSWGRTGKGIHGFLAEHVFVVEDRLYLGVTAEEFDKRAREQDGCGVMQRFVHTFRGAGIQLEEYVEDARVDFTVMADHDFTAQQWAQIWLCGEQQGIGASRSQGYGRYEVTRWDRIA